ncbi:DNA mismatch repair endonuclease MutL, partial [Paracoccaceae bacterium]|nr:DNA mismatch repair endonuclease MutL [Paracoccaceae bacterium]
NSLDAGASRIDVTYADGGKTLLRVVDNGNGIKSKYLSLAVSRHATSKIDGTDLLNIHTFGFRGEALPSLGAVGRLKITSRSSDADCAFEITVTGGKIGEVKPAAFASGTVVDLNDLFYATPARLKFLRSDKAESRAIADVVKRLAIAQPKVTFTLKDISKGGEGRLIFKYYPDLGDHWRAMKSRLAQVLGTNFTDNSIMINTEREEIKLFGYAALPTYSRGAAVQQFFFVNGRPIKDKLLIGALRAAYSDLLSSNRYPAAALFIECDPKRVDMNVHPAKAEVRFREPGVVRGLVVSGLKHILAESGHRSSSTIGHQMLGAFNGNIASNPGSKIAYRSVNNFNNQSKFQNLEQVKDNAAVIEQINSSIAEEEKIDDEVFPLGMARAHLFENYILAQRANSLVLVDSHAAHERIIYEKLKELMLKDRIKTQTLLIPEIINLSESDLVRLLEFSDELKSFGLVLEAFGPGAIVVRETPALLGVVNAENLIKDILDELNDSDRSEILKIKIDAILSRISCHGSIRSGRRLKIDEMNALLREMEITPHSGQCNHGRPTYVELSLSDVERMFGRK